MADPAISNAASDAGGNNVQPASPSALSSTSWAVPQLGDAVIGSATPAFIELFQKQMVALVDAHGGPAQYLRKVMVTIQSQNVFTEWLLDTFPEAVDAHYHYEQRIPTVSEPDLAMTPPTIIHVASFGWSMDCSLRPYPTRELFLALSELILQDGFCTSGEPLLVNQPQELFEVDGRVDPWKASAPLGSLKPHSVGYVKGMGRLITLLAMLHWP
jgi:hypothetical protein